MFLFGNFELSDCVLSFGCCIALGGVSLGMFDTPLSKAVVSKFSLWYSALPENQTRNFNNTTQTADNMKRGYSKIGK